MYVLKLTYIFAAEIHVNFANSFSRQKSNLVNRPPASLVLHPPRTTAGVLSRHLEVDDGPDAQPVELLDQTLFYLTYK
jgi:hypothetical protein